MSAYPQKITIGELRETGVHHVWSIAATTTAVITSRSAPTAGRIISAVGYRN